MLFSTFSYRRDTFCDVSRRLRFSRGVFAISPTRLLRYQRGTLHTYCDVLFPSCDQILTALYSCFSVLTFWRLYDVNRRISVLRRFADLPSRVASEVFRARVLGVLHSYGCFWMVASHG